MKHVSVAASVILLLATAVAQSNNPVPFLEQPLVPSSTRPGGSAFTLRVTGANFVPGSVVLWDGIPRKTQFISAGHLTAAIPAFDIATARAAAIAVQNPAPGGGVSSVVYLPIREPAPIVSTLGRPVDDGYRPYCNDCLVAQDFNHDGKVDLAVASSNDESSNVEVFIAEGHGDFVPGVSYTTTAYPFTMAVGDFNGDGQPDLAALGAATLAVFLGNPDGTFQPAKEMTAGSEMYGNLLAGDFNRDGKLDLIALDDEGDGRVVLLLGNGDGTFRPPIPVIRGYAFALGAGDFNGDGILDISVCAPLTRGDLVAVLLGNGDGTFQPPVLSATGNGFCEHQFAADFNGDGKLDLAVSNYPVETQPSINILLGKGDGTFDQPTAYGLPGAFSGGEPTAIAGGDLNADGALDLAVGTITDQTPQYLTVLVGKGDGTFLSVPSLIGNSPPTGIAAAPFSGHGNLDLAVQTFGGLSVLFLESPQQ